LQLRKRDFEDPSNQKKLQRLKKEISACGFPVCNYSAEFSKINGDGVAEFTGLEHFGEQFIQNVWAAIGKEFPADMEEPSELEREKSFHEEFMEQRIQNFVGRKDKLKELDKFVKTTGNQVLLVEGQPGM
jgi:hypothetical protein